MRRLPVLLAALPVLAILLALGTWQVQRLQWKTDLLARIAAAEAAPAEPLIEPPEPFAKVAVAGTFDHARAALLGLEVRGPLLGARLLTPLLREGAPAILVDRGWTPIEGAAPARPEGAVIIEGFVHPGDRPGLFSATDDPVARRFYTLDPPAIGAALGLDVVPFAIVALGPAGNPDPARALPRPTNNHLGYAITWYGLALALVGVVIAFLVRRPSDRRRAEAEGRAPEA